MHTDQSLIRFNLLRLATWDQVRGQSRGARIPLLARALSTSFAVVCLFACLPRPCLQQAGAADFSSVEKLYAAGKYVECMEAAREQVERRVWNDRWPRMLIRCQLTTGRYPAARATYQAALKRYSSNIPLRLLGIEVYRYNNDPHRAKLEQEKILQFVQSSPRRYSSKENLVALGRYFLARGEDAREVLEIFYDRARKSYPEYVDAYVATAELALEKHDYQLASESLDKAAKLRPDDPQIAYLSARAWQGSDAARAARSLTRALQLNPNHVPSLLLKASKLIDAEQYTAAEEVLTQVLTVNVLHPRAWAYHAAIAHLQGHYAGERELRDVALSCWETNPEVDFIIGEKLSRNYRFAEGARYQRSALSLNPRYLPAKFQLAQDLLRLGDEDSGWQMADEVHKTDGYNVVAHNLVTLHDTLKRFHTLEDSGLIVRMDAKEARIYGAQVIELLKEARSTLCQKYEVEPDKPVIVEIFPHQKDFAIRTFGLPGGAGFLGVCFGRVITANSPASQSQTPANWQAVLWHEFCHVVTLEKTNNKMPRWLSEGISVYEEMQRNPSWGQTMEPQYREMILSDDLTPVSQLSGAFLNPQSPIHLQFAYYESALVVEYVVQNYGLDILKRVLVDLGVGMPINESLARYVGSLERFDQEFAAFARGRANELAPEMDWSRDDLPERATTEQWSAWIEDHPNNYWGLRRYAQALIRAERWADARQTLEHLHGLYPADTTSGNALELLGQVHRELNDSEAEQAVLEKLASITSDSLSTYLRLVELSAAAEDWSAVADYARQVISVNPLLPVGQEMMSRAAEKQDSYEQVVAALQALAEMDPIDPAELHFRMARSLTQLGRRDEARRQVLMALEDAPRFRAAHKLLLELVDNDVESAEAEGIQSEQTSDE